MTNEHCIPFEIKFAVSTAAPIDPESCFADIIPAELSTEVIPAQSSADLVETKYQPTKKIYGLTHNLPLENPNLDDLLTSVL